MSDSTTAVAVILAEKKKHVFTSDLSGMCECGYEAQTVPDWDEHVAKAQVKALAVWMDSFTSPLVVNELGKLASAWASDHLRKGM
jgi:hypothetical protein